MKSKIIPLAFVFLNLESVQRKGKNYKNLNISTTNRAYWMKEKTFLIVFKELSLGEKVRI